MCRLLSVRVFKLQRSRLQIYIYRIDNTGLHSLGGCGHGQAPTPPLNGGENRPTDSHTFDVNELGKISAAEVHLIHCDCDPKALDCGTILMTLPSSQITLNRTMDKARQDCAQW